eukprot:GFYU01003991.1.p1 GENE.GFYU01003991.1~~GFYU01003991.1.p1  ORF type:complete len:323 (-),score=21.79 GFYU01003991.1:94-1062(-)
MANLWKPRHRLFERSVVERISPEPGSYNIPDTISPSALGGPLCSVKFVGKSQEPYYRHDGSFSVTEMMRIPSPPNPRLLPKLHEKRIVTKGNISLNSRDTWRWTNPPVKRKKILHELKLPREAFNYRDALSQGSGRRSLSPQHLRTIAGLEGNFDDESEDEYIEQALSERDSPTFPFDQTPRTLVEETTRYSPTRIEELSLGKVQTIPPHLKEETWKRTQRCSYIGKSQTPGPGNYILPSTLGFSMTEKSAPVIRFAKSKVETYVPSRAQSVFAMSYRLYNRESRVYSDVTRIGERYENMKKVYIDEEDHQGLVRDLDLLKE